MPAIRVPCYCAKPPCIAHSLLWTSNGRYGEHGVAANESDPPSIRRPCRPQVGLRICGQPKGSRRVEQLYVDVEVVPLLAVPGKRHLVAVRREGGKPLHAWKRSDRYDFDR